MDERENEYTDTSFVVVVVVVVVAVVVVDLGFTSLLTSQTISVAFYSEHEKSDKFCSEALISAWGSLACRKSTTRDPRLYFPSEGSHTQDFYALKKIHLSRPGFEPENLGSSGEYDNHGTTGGEHYLLREIKIVPSTK